MTGSANNALQQSLGNVAALLNDFTAQENSSGILTQVFGDSFNAEQGNSLIESAIADLTSGSDSENGLTIAILPAQQISNASGAYAASNNTIYLSEEFLLDNADNADAIADVVIDAVGHYLDAQANSTDAAGDEGEIFAAEVTGVALTEEELTVLRDTDDSGAVNVDGENIDVEKQASIIYVDRDAEGENNGTSWTNAYTDLQSALAAGGASDQIWVAEGTYVPTNGTNLPEDIDNPRDVSFVINNGVDVYGGFVGGETSLDQRDWQLNETILSGNIGESGQADNSYHVVDITGSTNTTIIDGFTITGGQADDPSRFSTLNDGAGIFGEENASATITNSTIENNFAGQTGGGLYVGDASSPSIVNTEFINNLASESGGGVYLVDTGSPNITNSLFTGNEAQQGGAVNISTVYSGAINDVVITNSTFANNSAGEGDSIFNNIREDEVAIHENNIFWNTEGRTDNHIVPRDISLGGFTDLPIVNNSIIQGGYAGEGENILIEDPLFVDPANDDYRLQVGSPGINAGNNEAIANLPVDTEVANNPRVYNETVDLGAYEYGLYASINDVRVEEGNEGTTNAEFTVTLLDTNDQPTTREVVIPFTTANSTARDDSDYTAANGTLTFAPGESTKTITVPVSGDTDFETNETFFVNLTSATGGAVITDNQGVGVIANDDPEPVSEADIPVYRFFRNDTQTQFYTTSEVERDAVLSDLPQYELEGISFFGLPEPEGDDLTGVRPIYRFFNTNTGIHLYTADENERAFVEENLSNFVPEPIPYYAYETQQEGTVPLYRFYNAGLDAHFYTPSAEERDFFIQSPDYQPEGGGDGIAFYVNPSNDI